MVNEKELSPLDFMDGEHLYRQRRKARFYSNARSTSPRRLQEDRRRSTRLQVDRRGGKDRRVGEVPVDPWGSAI